MVGVTSVLSVLSIGQGTQFPHRFFAATSEYYLRNA